MTAPDDPGAASTGASPDPAVGALAPNVVLDVAPVRGAADALDELRDRWRHAARRTLTLVLAAGLAFDAMVRNGVATASGTIAMLAIVVVVALDARPRRPGAIAALGGAVVFALFLSVRASPWIVPLDVLAVAFLVMVAVLVERRGDGPLGLGELAQAGGDAVGTAFVAPVHLAVLASATVDRRSVARRLRDQALLRGGAVALPVVVLIGALLASADGVFRSFLTAPLPSRGLVAHGYAVLAGACLALIPLVRRRSPNVRPPSTGPAFGATTELTVVLGAVAATSLVFTAAQATALVRGDAYVQRTTGLTYADHARRGYFQLLAAAAVTAAVLLVVRAVRPTDGSAAARRTGRLATVVASLTLVMIASAVRRLALYDAAFGSTMLRLACAVFAAWLAVVFVAMAITFRHRTPGRHDHLGAVVLVSAMATLFVWNAADPEAFVARRNLDRASTGPPIDLVYLSRLSSDAVPALIDGIDRRSPTERAALATLLCATPRRDADGPGPGWNRADSRAADSRRRWCP